MSLSAEQLQIASLIDQQVKRTLGNGGDEAAIVAERVEYMPGFKRLIDTSTATDREALAQRFDGFYHYAKILEHLATGIQSGQTRVPDSETR